MKHQKPTGKDEENPLFVSSLEKGMSVLAALADAGRPLSLADISRLSGIGRSAAQRFIFTLKALGYVDQGPTTRLYTLSARMLEFGEVYTGRDTVQQLAYPVLEEANRECGETINLTVLNREDVVYILRLPSRQVVSVNLNVGSRLPAYCTAPGRAILAYLKPAEAQRILDASVIERRTPYTETSRGRIMALLQEVRERGYSLNDQEAFIGDISTAAAVRDRSGRPVAAVNIAVPFPRWTPERVRSELTPLVMSAAARISALMGRPA